MNEITYKKNLEALKKYNKSLADLMIQKEYLLMEGIHVYSEFAKTGEIIFKIENNESVLYIDGKYNPKAKMDKWFFEQKKFEYESVVIVVGFGNAMYLKELISKTKESVAIMIYEPCVNIFLKALEEIDLEEVFMNRALKIVVDGLNDDKTKSLLNEILSFDNLSLLHHLVLGNYDRIFSSEIKQFIEIEKKCIEGITRTCGTILNFMDVNGVNFLNNITYLYDNYTTSQLKNSLPDDIPSIIVAAGPSLNKNIKDLKCAKNKSCIIATDTALKPLLNNEIIPDFVVIVDGKKPGLLFEHENLSDIPMVMSAIVSKDPVNMHKGKKFFSWDGTLYETEIIKIAKQYSEHHENIDMTSLATGGSVATTAYSFAKLLGSKVIILVGQDLAFTNNRTHADGTFKDKMDEIDVSNGELIEVEDIYGNPIYTRYDYKAYLDWFNEAIPTSKDVHVIDATEGGAKITGTEILTLKQAIERECTKEINIQEIIEQVKPIFHEKIVKEQIKEFFQSTPDRFLEVRKKLKQGINHYNKMIKICKQKKFNTVEFVKISDKVNKITEFLNTDGVAHMLIERIRDVDYTLRATIYNTEDNENDERIMIAKQGKVLLEAMNSCIDELMEIAEQTVGKVGVE